MNVPATTVSAGGVVLRDGQVVVVHQYGRTWSLPKGKVEPGEVPLDAAIREIREECGLRRLEHVRPLGEYERRWPGRDSRPGRERERKRIVMFLFRTDEESLAPEDAAITEARWVPKQDVASLLTNPGDAAFFRSLEV